MSNRHWLMNLARTFALVGVLGITCAVARAEDESDSDRDQDRTSQSREEDRDRSSSDDDDSDSREENRSRSESRNRDDDSDSREESRNRDNEAGERSNRNRDDSDRSSARNRQSSQREESSRNSSRQSRNQGSQNRNSSNQQQDVGAEFETDDNDRVKVSNVEDDSIAQRSRLAEDDVIISVDGRRFTDTRQLTSYLRSAGNRSVPIIIERDGTRYTVQLQDAQQNNQQRDWQASRNSNNSEGSAWLGVYLDDNEDGPVITQVYPNGPAARAGLRRGDVVVQFNNEDVTDSEELVSWIEEERPNSRARFTVLRDGEEMKLTATLADREQFVARGQSQNQDQYSNQARSTQRQFNQQDNWQNDRNQNQNRQYTEYRDNDRNDSRGYSSYNYPGRGQQMQESRQTNDQHQRLERMIKELREEVQELRDRVDNNDDE